MHIGRFEYLNDCGITWGKTLASKSSSVLSLPFLRFPEYNIQSPCVRMQDSRKHSRAQLPVLLVFTHVINRHVFQRKQKEAFA